MLKWWSAAFGALLGIALFGAANGQILRFSGGSVLPPGVSLLNIDGGPTFFATNNFTNAARSITFNGTTYANGWDSAAAGAGFFPVGPWLSPFATQADANRWISIGLNTAFSFDPPVAGQSTLFKNNGISVINSYQLFGSNMWVDTSGPGTETVGWLVYDEPTTIYDAIQYPVAGNAAVSFSGTITGNNTLTVNGSISGSGIVFPFIVPSSYVSPQYSGAGLTGGAASTGYGTGTGATGTYGICAVNTPINGSPPNYSCDHTLANVGPITITQPAIAPLTTALQNNRFMWTNFTNGNLSLGYRYDKNGSHVSIPTLLGTTYTAADGVTQRHIDMQSLDLYFFTESYDTMANNGALGDNKTLATVYDTSGNSIFTLAQGARGSHYGDMIDMQRAFETTFNIPVWTFIENGNCNCVVAYDIQPVEINWAVWSCIIHGCRAIAYFNQEDGQAPSTCNIGDNFNCAYMKGAQSVTVTGSITGSVLTVTTTPTNGILAPGMVATSITSTILQQLTPTAGSKPGGVGTYSVSGGTLSSGPVTYGQPASMVSAVASTNALVATLAPVINSPFAKGYVTPSPNGYQFENGLTQSCGALQSITCGTATGIETMAKYYNNGQYTATTGDVISNGFYIFADTRNAENSSPTTATFTLAGHASNIKVINESRSITPSGGGFQFTDTFANAWTVHIYQVVP